MYLHTPGIPCMWSHRNMHWLPTSRKSQLQVEVGYRGSYLGHSFKSFWTPDKLITLSMLITFLKKKLKKVHKPGCPDEKSKMAAKPSKNHIFYHNSKGFCLVAFILVAIPMVWGIRNHSMQLSSRHDFSFSWYCCFSWKLDREGALQKRSLLVRSFQF